MNSTAKTITILYFAALREQAGKEQEILQTNSQTIAQLYEQLQKQYGFDLPITHLRVAANHTFCTWEYILQNNDIIAFIPPVAGG